MSVIQPSAKIHGVKFVHLKAYADDRGRFLETFRKAWFPERTWEIIQTNRSDSSAGVLRGLHYHFHQIDYWYVPAGLIRVGLADIRVGSPTFGAVETLEIGDGNDVGVFIPCGVAHGFLALQPATLTYLVDQYYNGADELGVLWNDPTLAVPWGVDHAHISKRDQDNPRLGEIPPALTPHWAADPVTER